jgi:hypothetical protein
MVQTNLRLVDLTSANCRFFSLALISHLETKPFKTLNVKYRELFGLIVVFRRVIAVESGGTFEIV